MSSEPEIANSKPSESDPTVLAAHDFAAVASRDNCTLDAIKEIFGRPGVDAKALANARFFGTYLSAHGYIFAPSEEERRSKYCGHAISALHVACRIAIKTGDLDIFEFLLDNGADVNGKSGEDHRTILSWASLTDFLSGRRDVMLKIIDVILNHGANPNECDDRKFTPLHYAAFYGCPAAIRKLLHAGADANARNNVGDTPLVCAIKSERDKFAIEKVKALVDAGAWVKIRDSGWTPLMFAMNCYDGQDDPQIKAIGDAIKKTLLDAGAGSFHTHADDTELARVKHY